MRESFWRERPVPGTSRRINADLGAFALRGLTAKSDFCEKKMRREMLIKGEKALIADNETAQGEN
jgi:hypothetical protein